MAVRYGFDDPAWSDRVVMLPRLWRMRRALIIRSTEHLSGTAQPKHQRRQKEGALRKARAVSMEEIVRHWTHTPILE